MNTALKLRAEQLYVPGVVGHKSVARMLGVSPTTVRRWLNPEEAEKMRIQSRDAKRLRRGVCEVCGGETRYSGHGRVVSTICASCSEERDRAARVWTREAVIAAIQRWAVTHGRAPTATDWKRSGDDYPAASNIYRSKHHSSRNNPFASWADAISAAGFERPETGGRYRERRHLWKFDHDEALRLLGEGLAGAEVARRLGISQTTISTLKLSDGGTFAQRRAQPTAEEVGRPSRSAEASID